MSDYDMSIHTNPDARAWAKFYSETRAKSADPSTFDDEENMIGWFANAMMAMHDHLTNRERNQWKPIASAPEGWSDVLLHDPEYRNDRRKVFEGYYDNDLDCWLSANGEPVSPTHWQYLPGPPENFESGANAAANSPAPEVSEASPTRTSNTIGDGND